MQVRPATPQDLDPCSKIDSSYSTDRVWQMDTRTEEGVVTTTFREVHLPRDIRVEYPRRGADLIAGWERRDGFLVACQAEKICGYVALTAQAEHGIAWVGDLIVDRAHRRQGVGTALLRAALRWGREEGLVRIVIELQTKNYPAISFCQARGFTFCGYNDHFWPSQDIALFFGQSLH
ncbi:MAG: GNAT family N-acetyltransferase [Anaerolineales bacterium]|nr:GNAT family N-acetyltransferase [Anaerolineales bacterium]